MRQISPAIQLVLLSHHESIKNNYYFKHMFFMVKPDRGPETGPIQFHQVDDDHKIVFPEKSFEELFTIRHDFLPKSRKT